MVMIKTMINRNLLKKDKVSGTVKRCLFTLKLQFLLVKLYTLYSVRMEWHKQPKGGQSFPPLKEYKNI